MRGRICLGAAAMLLAQAVTAVSVRSAHDDDSLCCRRASADSATSDGAADESDRESMAADDSALRWFDAVLDDRSSGPFAPTWWDLLLCESAQ